MNIHSSPPGKSVTQNVPVKVRESMKSFLDENGMEENLLRLSGEPEPSYLL